MTAASCAELEATWHREIPLAAAMQIEVVGYENGTLTTRAPLPPNRNLHGSAFAGSLYGVCVLTGWGATWLALRERGLEGLIVIADAEIDYRRAVTAELVCRCTPTASVVAEAVAAYASTGRMSLPLTCTIDNGERRAVTFTGTYVVHAEHRP